MNRYSKYNPFFRKNLLKFLIGKELKNIEKITWGDKNNKSNFDKYFWSSSNSGLYSLSFNDIKINIGYHPPRIFEVYEDCYEMKAPIQQFPDLLQKQTGRILLPQKINEEKFRLDILNVKNDAGLKNLIGLKVLDCFLLEQTNTFSQAIKYGRSLSYLAAFKMVGFGLKFEKNKFLYVYLNFGPDSRAIIIETLNNEWLEKDFFKISKNFITAETEVKSHLLHYKIKLPIVNLDKFTIGKIEILDDSILKIASFTKFNVNELVLESILREYKTIDINRQIDFLESLKSDMKVNKYGLADLKFGLDLKLNFKVVKPVDIIPPIAENILFIDSITKILKKTNINPDGRSLAS